MMRDGPPERRRGAVGLDAGSTSLKIVEVNERGDIVWSHTEETAADLRGQLSSLMRRPELSSLAEREMPLVATGHGRGLVDEAARTVTEITCHARGVFRALGRAGTLIDVGGQDSKVVVMDGEGTVVDFAMNDKCAAGTGRFLESCSRRLGLSLEALSELAVSTEEEVPISNTCVVFAESEIVSLIAQGTPLPAMVRGLLRSLTRRTAALARGVRARPPFMFSGGVALNPAAGLMLSEELGAEVLVPSQPQMMGAHGAALEALRAGASRIS